MKLQWSYKVMTVWGIPIKAHISLVLLLFVMPWELPPPVLGVLLITVGMLSSITLHELAHSFLAKKKGCHVQDIVLLPIGGVARMQIPEKPKDELVMAVAGPATSFVLGAVILSFALAVWHFTPPAPGFWTHLLFLVMVIGIANFSYVIFNMLPAFPMDGGRVLRALLVKKYGRLRATFVASLIGKVLAIVIILVGLMFIKQFGLFVLIGAFVFMGAHNEYRAVERQEQAKMFGFDYFQPGASRPLRYAPEDPGSEKQHAIVEPPPYERGPGKKATVHHLRDPNDL